MAEQGNLKIESLRIAQDNSAANTFASEHYLYGQVEKSGKVKPEEFKPLEARVAQEQPPLKDLNATLEAYRGPVISGFFKLTKAEQAKLFANTPELKPDISWTMNFITIPKDYPENEPFGFYVINEAYYERTQVFKTYVDKTCRLEGKLLSDAESGMKYFVGKVKYYGRGRVVCTGQLDDFWLPLSTEYDQSSDQAILDAQRKRWLKSSNEGDKWEHDDREKFPAPKLKLEN